MVGGDPSKEYQASLVVDFTSAFLARIVCIDVSFVDQLLVCGDQRDNIVAFEFPVRLIDLENTSFKHFAHLKEPMVSQVWLAFQLPDQMEIKSVYVRQGRIDVSLTLFFIKVNCHIHIIGTS